ncbi:MAG: flagellar hook-associated protein FlgL [Planktomarina sp.]|nr:flagellar hook-associated protein FlgL [Planktomarina sp.]
MEKLDEQITKKQAEVSSGKKDLGLAKDSVSINRVNYINMALSQLDRFKDGIQAAAGHLKTQETALAEVENSVMRLYELGLQANTDTLSPDQKKLIGVEVKQLKLNILDRINAKDQRGNAIFGGTIGKNDAFVINDKNNVRYVGTLEEGAVSISENRQIASHLNGHDIFMKIPSGSGQKRLFDIIETFENSLRNTGMNLDQTIKDLLNAHTHIIGTNSNVGAKINMLTKRAESNEAVKIEILSELSSLQDTDLAAAITDINQLMLTKDATQQIYAKISQQSLFDFIR